MYKNLDAALREKLSNVRLVVTDVDGVHTNDTFSLGITPNGERIELYTFYTGDGIAVKECLRAGIPVVLISGRKSPAVRQRAADLGAECLQGVVDKVAVVDELLTELGLEWNNVLFIGNDVQDISLLRRAGFSATPAEAAIEAQAEADYVAKKKGGRELYEKSCSISLRPRDYGRRLSPANEHSASCSTNRAGSACAIFYNHLQCLLSRAL